MTDVVLVTSGAIHCDRCRRRVGALIYVKTAELHHHASHGTASLCITCFTDAEAIHAKLAHHEVRPFIPTLVWQSSYTPQRASRRE